MRTRVLSQRELETLRTMWAQPELSCKGLADALCIEQRTLGNHITSILNKMGVTTRVAAIKRGLEMGLLEVATHEHRLRHVCEDCGEVFG